MLLTWQRTDVSWPQAPLADLPWPGHEFARHWGRPEPWRRLSRRQRQLLLCLAASSRHPPSLAAALAQCGAVVTADVLAAAAAAGDLAACEALLAAGCDWSAAAVLEAAARYGHLHVCHWVQEVECRLRPGRRPHTLLPLCCDTDLLTRAASRGGNAGVVLAWVRQQAEAGNQTVSNCHIATGAAEVGDIELLVESSSRSSSSTTSTTSSLTDATAERRLALLPSICYGCPLAVLQVFWGGWGYRPCGRLCGGALGPAAQQLLVAAAMSPTPDWAAKCEWLLRTWGPERLAGWAACQPGGLLLSDPHTGRLVQRHLMLAAAASSHQLQLQRQRPHTHIHSRSHAQTSKQASPSPDTTPAPKPSPTPGTTYLTRLQYLAARGLGLPHTAGLAAVYAGDVAAAELCLDYCWPQPPGPPPAATAAGAATAATAFEDAAHALEEWQRTTLELMAQAAVRSGCVGVLSALRARGGAASAAAMGAVTQHLLGADPADFGLLDCSTVNDWSAEWRFRGGPAVAWLLDLMEEQEEEEGVRGEQEQREGEGEEREQGEGREQGEQEARCGEQAAEAGRHEAPSQPPQRQPPQGPGAQVPLPQPRCWSRVFRLVAVLGGGAGGGGAAGQHLALLRRLVAERGAAVDLEAVARGGGVEALEWAAEQAAAAGGLKPLSQRAFDKVLSVGNWAAADWLLASGLAPPPRELQAGFSRRAAAAHMPDLAALRWLVARAGVAVDGGAGRQLGRLALNAVGGQAAWVQELLAAAAED